MAEPIKDLPGEIWKPVVGYEGLYEVSNLGSVRSLDRWLPVQGGVRRKRGQALKLMADRDGYLFVNFTAGTSASHRKLFVHWLVLEAFVELRPAGAQACHGNGDKRVNTPENLRWGTASDNGRDKAAHGSGRGSKHPRAKLTEDAVRRMRALYAGGGHTQDDLAAEFGCSSAAAHFAIRGITWSHVV